jgi:hypothetical protein
LATWTPEDGLLGALAPLGLAAAAGGSALLVDLDPSGPRYPGSASLAELVAEGPRRADLRPERPGIAVLRNGGITAAEAAEVVEALLAGWGRVVLRLPPRPPAESVSAVPVVPVRLLLPGGLFEASAGPGVYQSMAVRLPLPQGGLRLPRPSVATVRSLLTGRLPAPTNRWLHAWRRVWRFPWEP